MPSVKPNDFKSNRNQAPAFGEDDYRVCLEHGVIEKVRKPHTCHFTVAQSVVDATLRTS